MFCKENNWKYNNSESRQKHKLKRLRNAIAILHLYVFISSRLSLFISLQMYQLWD